MPPLAPLQMPMKETYSSSHPALLSLVFSSTYLGYNWSYDEAHYWKLFQDV